MILTKEKKQHLGIVALGTVVVSVVIYLLLITRQQKIILKLQQDGQAAQAQVETAEKLTARKGTIGDALRQAASRLRAIEVTLPSEKEDFTAWIDSTLTRFQELPGNENVIINQAPYSPPRDTDMIPNLPYQSITVKLQGLAFYHDLGRFIANLENSFPYYRLQNLDIAAGAGLAIGGEAPHPEKLQFTVEMVALVKEVAQ